jgi:hypothetical protein
VMMIKNDDDVFFFVLAHPAIRWEANMLPFVVKLCPKSFKYEVVWA